MLVEKIIYFINSLTLVYIISNETTIIHGRLIKSIGDHNKNVRERTMKLDPKIIRKISNDIINPERLY